VTAKKNSAETARQRAARLAKQRLESLRDAGVSQLPRRRAKVTPPATARPAATAPPAATARPAAEARSPAAAAAPRVGPARTSSPEKPVDRAGCTTLAALNQKVTACTRCPALVENRTQTVFGVGNPQPRLCFLGEAPGADEDRQGEPFVGRAGQLLTKMIEACTMKREDVYILNVLKCRPPGNRTPEPQEVDNCRPFFERQIELLRPQFICCLGAVAAQSLLRTTTAVGRLRGTVHDYRGIKVVVTYHPAYLLRAPNQKRAAWEDMKLLMREMGLKIPEHSS
jgi:uracil-DNA glycosylase